MPSKTYIKLQWHKRQLYRKLFNLFINNEKVKKKNFKNIFSKRNKKFPKVRYLKEFGYLQETFDHWENIASDKQFQIALKSLQKSHGLADTGFIDDATCKLIKEPQCAGMISSDSFNEKKLKHRARRYASFELRWPKTNITWR